jgi:predicted nucleotidyltransferase
MNYKDNIKHAITNLLIELQKYNSVNEIRLFGSQALEYKEKSDIDLLIICINQSEYKDIIKTVSLASQHNNLLFHPVVYHQDISILQENIYIKENILEKSIVLFLRS